MVLMVANVKRKPPSPIERQTSVDFCMCTATNLLHNETHESLGDMHAIVHQMEICDTEVSNVWMPIGDKSSHEPIKCNEIIEFNQNERTNDKQNFN